MIVFVPFKGTSARVPNKNFREFGGKPLWKHTVDKFKEVGTVHISTDVPALEGTDDAVRVTQRPHHLAIGGVSMNIVIAHWLENNEGIPDDEPIAQIHVTTPFLQPDTVVRAASFYEYGADSAVAVNTIKARLWREEERPGGRVSVPLNHNPMLLEDTQNLPPVLAENSLFYIFTKGSFYDTNNRLGRHPWLCPVKFPENVDIDTLEDWKLAKSILEMMNADS